MAPESEKSHPLVEGKGRSEHGQDRRECRNHGTDGGGLHPSIPTTRMPLMVLTSQAHHGGHSTSMFILNSREHSKMGR